MSTVIKRCRGEKLMIPDSENECPEHEVKSKTGNIFVNEKILLLRFMKLILTFMSITEKKYKLMKMGVNICYIELMFILLNISKPLKLMKKVILTETLFLRRKGKKH